METAIYYRDEELITQSDLDLMYKVWEMGHYNRFSEYVIDQNSGSGLHIVTELLGTISTTESLNERDTKLRERIKKGLTWSRGFWGGYVESNMLSKLISDALIELNKSVDKPYDLCDVPFIEFSRLYGIPYKSVMDDVKKSIEQIGVIPEPPRYIQFERYYNDGPASDQCSSYQLNYIKVKHCPLKFDWNCRGEKSISRLVHDKFPFVGKVHKVINEDYIQVYLYDYRGSEKGLKTVLCFLEDNGVEF